MTELPWRRRNGDQHPGLPAWSTPISHIREQGFAVDQFADITVDWALEGADGAGVRVCVLDSGIDDSHPLIGGLERAVRIRVSPSGSLEVVDVRGDEPADSVGHGTACAGIIRSVAPQVSLISTRVLTDGMYGQGAALLTGLEWALNEGIDVINLSLSTMRSEFYADLHRLADTAYFRRSVIVASAHNMPVRSFPWTFSSVISVASHDESDKMSYYYNPSPPAEFYAHGVRVHVPWTGGTERRVTGNSFAAPHIAGICSLILSKHRWLTPFQVKSVLYLTAKNVAQRLRNEGDDGSPQ
jgi:subtilisin family serine protease